MTWLFDFIHARKWLMELILLGVIVAAVAYWHHATFEAGIQHQKHEDAIDLAEAIADAKAHETKIAKEASDAYEQKLADIRSAAPIGAVRLCHAPKPVPATATATGQPDAPAGGRVEGTPEEDPGPDAGPDIGPDIGPALDTYGGDCAAVAARLESLQEWVRKR